MLKFLLIIDNTKSMAFQSNLQSLLNINGIMIFVWLKLLQWESLKWKQQFA